MDRRVDLAIAVVLAGAGGWLVWQAQHVRVSMLADPIGPRAMPTAIGIFLLVAGVALGLRRAVELVRNPGDVVAEPEGRSDEPGHPASTWRPLVLLALAVAYSILFPLLGYIVTTVAFVVSGLLVMRTRRLVMLISATALYVAITFVLFDVLLGVPLPTGILR